MGCFGGRPSGNAGTRDPVTELMTRRYYLAAVALVMGGWVGAQNGGVPVEWELNVEGGLDLRAAYRELTGSASRGTPDALVDGARQGVGYYAGASAMRRLAGLRALWGLRLDGHAGAIDYPGENTLGARGRSATVTLAYRFFPLDLHGDCDCPTWGSDPWLRKALFLEAGAGLGYQRYAPEATTREARDRFGAAYAARVGVSHRLRKAFDVYAAAGLHGIIGDNAGFRRHDLALRPTLGLTWRPGR